jgi:hypothetical protein
VRGGADRLPVGDEQGLEEAAGGIWGGGGGHEGDYAEGADFSA